MDFLVNNWVLVLLVLTSGAMLLFPGLGKVASGGVTPAQTVTLINRHKAKIIDVAEKAEFDLSHIKGATHLPLAQVASGLASVAKNKEQILVFSCPAGSRAKIACKEAIKLGYAQAQYLAGGNKAWALDNLPTEKAAAALA